jgi:hypothetical protein
MESGPKGTMMIRFIDCNSYLHMQAKKCRLARDQVHIAMLTPLSWG